MIGCSALIDKIRAFHAGGILRRPIHYVFDCSALDSQTRDCGLQSARINAIIKPMIIIHNPVLRSRETL